MHGLIHLLLFFYFKLHLNLSCEEVYSLISILSFFANCFSKKCINDNTSKLLFPFGQAKWIGQCVYFAPLLDPSRNRNNAICGYVNLKNNFKEFQEGDEIVQNLKKGKAKWRKYCA